MCIMRGVGDSFSPYRGHIIYELAGSSPSVSYSISSGIFLILSFTLEKAVQALEERNTWGTGPDFLLRKGYLQVLEEHWEQVYTRVWSLRLITPGREHTRHFVFFLAPDQAKVFPVVREPQPFPNAIQSSNSISKKKHVASAAANHLLQKCGPTCRGSRLAHHRTVLGPVIYEKLMTPPANSPDVNLLY